jgi:hypothetical protein
MRVCLFKFKIILFIFLTGLTSVHSQIWTLDSNVGWTYKVSTSGYSAYLWLPARIKNVSAFLITVKNVSEAMLISDTLVRKTLADLNMGLVFIDKGIYFHRDTNIKWVLDALMDSLALVSGFQEIKHCPFVTFGHSTAALFAHHIAYVYPQRVFMITHFKTGGINEPKWLKHHVSIDHIPYLAITGELEEYGPFGALHKGVIKDNEQVLVNCDQYISTRDSLLKHRKNGMPVCQVVEPAHGHYKWTTENSEFFCLFLRKAHAAKIPQNKIAFNQPINLKEVKLSAGYLVDTIVKAEDIKKPQKYCKYKGDKSTAWWFFDKEIAEQWHFLHNGRFFKQNRYLRIDYITNGNGEPGYDKQNKILLSRDTIVLKGRVFNTRNEKVDVPVKFSPVCGFVKQINDSVFKVYNNDGWKNCLQIIGFVEADSFNRYAERLTLIPYLEMKKDGLGNIISFQEITEKKVGDTFDLNFTATSNLPVDVFVEYGPARIIDNKVIIDDFANNHPNKEAVVQLVAFQNGNKVYNTADNVRITFKVTK